MPNRRKPYRTQHRCVYRAITFTVTTATLLHSASFRKLSAAENPACTRVCTCGDDSSRGARFPSKYRACFRFQKTTRRRIRFPANPNTGPCRVYLVDACLRTRTSTFFPFVHGNRFEVRVINVYSRVRATARRVLQKTKTRNLIFPKLVFEKTTSVCNYRYLYDGKRIYLTFVVTAL